jgi:hypothetical protein
VPSGPPPPRPPLRDLPAPQVREIRRLLAEALDARDDSGRRWGDAQWGVYAFYDYDGEPIYVGQTNERLRIRVRRHLTNQRTDAVAMRVLDTFEVAEMELWPMWDLEGTARSFAPAKRHLDALEYAVYLQALGGSRFNAILNEKIPPVSPAVRTMPVSQRFALISGETRAEREHPDIRIARRAETISRLGAVVHERGEVSAGLRRVLVVQAMRLTYLTAARLAFAEGRAAPDPRAIDTDELVGSVLEESPGSESDEDLGSEHDLDG